MSRQKLITVTKEQIEDIAKGKYTDFMKNMISLGAHSLKEGGVGVGERLDNIKGPYKAEDGSMLFVMNINTLTSGD